MLDALRFVQGAVAKKDFVPALKHFRIEDGRVTSYNGVIALSAPIALNLTVTPRADQFARAIATCDGEIALTVTPSGRIGIRSQGFRAYVDCTDEPFPHVSPEGIEIPLTGSPLLYALQDVWPFISDDASRAWSQGVLIQDKSVFATNNVILIERWLGAPFPFAVNIPRDAVAEMIRIGEEPVAAHVKENCLTLMYRDERWLRTQLLTTEWPAVKVMLDRAHDGADARMQPVQDGFFEALEKLAPFLGELNRVFYCNGGIHTSLLEGEGASVELPGVEGSSIFNYKMLKSLGGTAVRWDLSSLHGTVCPFTGTMLRGVMVGYK